MKRRISLILLSALILVSLLAGCQNKEPEKLHTDQQIDTLLKRLCD